MDIIMAADINNEAMQLEMAGNYLEAEKKFVEALRIKEESDYSTPINIALSQNALAELYLKMGKLDEAQVLLEKAFAVRSGFNNFDTTCTADNLGRLFEMRGNPEMAVEWRTRNGQHRMICTNFDCPKSRACQFSKFSELKKCGKCKCAYYCDKDCQTVDWGRHKLYCKKRDVKDAAP